MTAKAIDQSTIDNLKSDLRGELLLPGSANYDEARSIWNGMIDRKPALIARCLGVADVVKSVNFAKEKGLLVSIKGGGHNISGLAVCDGGLTIDMSLMRGAWVDHSSNTVHAQAGCLLGDVDRETQLYGKAANLGFVSNTGIAGLTLGGGFGYLTRRFGWTTDNVISMEMVTADGQIVRASENENPDLFWGLRGGGGNFGVVTKFEYKLHPVGPEIVGGLIAWKGEATANVLELYRTLAEKAPPELTCVVLLRNAPPAPWLAKEIHGKPIAAILVCHSGAIEEGEKLMAPIKAFGSPVGDVIQRRPYVTQQNLLDATQPKGRRYYWKSEYLPGHDPLMLERFAEHGGRIQSPHSAIILFQLDGKLNELANEHSPVGNRNTKTVLNMTASWESPDDDQENIDWARTAWQDIHQFSTGGTYLNFLTEEEVGDRLQDAWGGNYDRLVDIKTKWDPENFFRMNKNIPPRKT